MEITPAVRVHCELIRVEFCVVTPGLGKAREGHFLCRVVRDARLYMGYF